jgi:signal transduction histidine kinase/CheY-like chemotaxis protein
LVLVATLLPAGLIGLRFAQDRVRQIEAARTELLTAATSLAADLDDRIQGTAQLLYGLARARDLDSADRDACSIFLSDVRLRYPQYTGILSITPDGNLFCDSLRTRRDLVLTDRAYFRAAQASDGDEVALEPVFGRLTGVPVVQVAYPARAEGGALRFVLLASLNLAEFVQEQINRMVADPQILLLDSQGQVLFALYPSGGHIPAAGEAAPGALAAFAADGPPRRTAEIADEAGRVAIWATSTAPLVQRAGLRILVGQPRDTLTAAANRRLAQDLIVLTTLSLLLVIGVWALGEYGIRRPIGRVAAFATRLGRGELEARIPPPLPRGELGALMEVLNGAAESMQRQRADIEQLSRRLAQSQKMEAVGQLTGGLAHDFNNLLTVILGTTELLAEQTADDPDLRQLADTAAQAALRGAELTRSLLAFARRQPLEPKPTDIGALLRRMEMLMRRTLGEPVETRLDLPREPLLAMADPAQLEAAVLNLVLNARDAMPQGGALTIEVGAAVLDQAYADAHEEVRAGDYVCVAVTDSGAGMTPEVVQQAFEPFFTTKPFGRGSGLGLSMVYGFAKQSGGHVKIYSEVGQGTTVRLYLPRLTDPGMIAAAPTGGAAQRGGHERVLVVEDDEMVRARVVAELRHLGYAVLEARDGNAALDILRGAEPIDLLFTDVVMPGGLSGPQLAAAAQALRPGLRVLYTSGYTQNAVVHDGRLDDGVVLLSKPYRRQELAAKLRQVLDA